MFAAIAEERSCNITSQNHGKDMTKSGTKVKKKAHSPEGTLPPLGPKPPALSAAFVARPQFSRTPILQNAPRDRPLSVVELPRLLAQEGPGRKIDDSKWTEGPRLMASVLGTNIPVRAAAELTTRSLAEKDEPIKVRTCKDKKITTAKDGKATKPSQFLLTGIEIVQIFAQKRNLTELELYYLKEVDGDSYRPYDLQGVHSSEAGSEHYIFSPNSVLHVTEKGYGGLVSLAEWYRESVLWTALQEISFFRDFRLRKAFTWWHRNVRRIFFQRRCENLQDMLLIAVPQFRSALHLLSRLIEDLKVTHWLPQEDSQTYTLLEFKNALITKNQECLQNLQELSQYRTAILNALKENSYKAHQELQLHMEYAKKPNKSYKPIYLHLAHQQELKKELARSESILQKLGNFAFLINQMIVQSLVTVVRQDAISFLSNVLKGKKSQQCALFHTELCFSTSSLLIVDPPIHLFQEAVSEALLTVGNSIIQMCDTCGFFLEIGSSVSSSDCVQDITHDLSCIEQHYITGEDKYNDGISGHRKFCCWRLLRDLSVNGSMLPKRTLLTVQGSMVHGCYYPLSRTQLEREIGIKDFSKDAEREQAEVMQGAALEIQQLCDRHKWLVDINLFICQWSRASVELMKDQPALWYEEHIKKMRHWAERINAIPSSISTSNQLFIIHCNHTKETLGRQLRIIEEEVLELLVEQIKLHSESLVSDLERATAKLKTEPQDLHDLSKYALTVRESVNMLADMHKQLEYVHSLQDTVCVNHRKMTEQEQSLEEKMQGLWDCFIPLLKEADSIVCRRLPSTAKALDTMFSFLVCDLKNTVSKATSGPFLDPAQNAKEMVSRLNNMCAHVHSLNAKLEQLDRNSQNLQEHTMDLTILTVDVQRIKTRRELWELVAAYSKWMEEWKQLLFSEVVVSQAQEKIARWKEQARSLTSIILTHDAVLQETLGTLESLSHRLAVMAKLQSPTLRHKHWRAIFEGLGLVYVPEKVTASELMSQQLEVHQKLITKICRDAQAESNIEQAFQKLQQGWKAKLFQLDKFTFPVWQYCELQCGLTETEKPAEDMALNLQTACQHSCNDARFIIIGLEIDFAEIENDLMTLSAMLKSPYSFEFRRQMEDWVQTLQYLEKLLDLFERYQQIWAFLTKMFNETFFSAQRVDLLEQFQPVDETFKEIMHTVSAEPHVLNLVNSKRTNDRFHGNSLCQILIDGLATMETISSQMVGLLDAVREQFPRLLFLSDREVIQLLSFHPVPFMLQCFVRKCFKGVRWLEVDSEIPSDTRDVKSCEAISGSHRQVNVRGVFASLREHITFLSPLKPNLNVLVWLSVFEKQLKLTMVQLMKQCAIAQNQLRPSSQDLAHDMKVGDILLQIASRGKNIQPLLDLLSEYPLQCVLVAEEAVWCSVVLQAFQESGPVKLSTIKAYNSAKLKTLGCSIRNGITGAKRESLVSKYMMMCLRALVELTMNHAWQLTQLMEVQCVQESSFEWLSLLKYHINSDDQCLKSNDDPVVFVDVLGHHFQYGMEYFGPENLVMVHTPSTDRAILGILLALTGYRCGFVSGPCMSGKKKTAVQLGKALGRQVVIIPCCPSLRPAVVRQMLFGALQSGAWILLDSVDLLTLGVLSSLGQHLEDIHQSFCGLTGNRNQRVNDGPKERTAGGVTGCTNIVDLAGKSISANLNFGCVLISSKGYTSEVPESLRFASRPVALMHPDYRIIAEVLMTSIGFSEAMSLSHRLVCLLSLAKDSCCLPDFISDDQSCYLVFLHKIISASAIHLKRNVRQREISDEAEGSAAEKTDLTSSQNVPVTVAEKDSKEFEKPSRLCSSHLSIIQGLMEETAIVKAILSVLLPVIYDDKKTSQFYSIFKDTFPIACQFPIFQEYIEEEEKNQVKDAVAEELQRQRFHSDTEIICSALTLYQTMKLSPPVLLIGPSGSGKTTCYRALAGALSSLASKAVEYMFENDSMIKGNAPQADPQISASHWSPVDTVVLFPNAMSHQELFGCLCGKRGWQDGAVPKVLRVLERLERTSSKPCNNEKRSDQKPVVKWLVMDGEPVGQPGWLDHLSTLFDPEDPFLFLSSGETLVPSPSHLKLLMETTDLSDASPSVVTRCSLVHVTGNDLWRSVWKNKMDAFYCENRLHQGALTMWSRLAEDLFSGTLSLLRQKALTSAIHSKGESFKSPTYGLQEIMSFIRILCALLQHFGKEVEKAEAVPQKNTRDIPLHGTDSPGTDAQSKNELLTRDLFLVAYIWGFGGHLHPGHWPQFDLLVRQVLFNCRYKIVVPDGESVFEHFFSIASWMYPRKTLLTNSIIPKYGKYSYLLNLMLEANQPVLLAGEPGSGKTRICQTLLSFDKPHISLPASPLLCSRDLHAILSNISSQRYCKDTVGPGPKWPRLLLFVDDLHEAPCDAYGKTSTALESLRQSISEGEILTFDTYHFRSLSSETISYMATYCVSGRGNHHNNAISSRLSRLFSIFVLPSLSVDIILSIHSPKLQVWLKQMPLKQSGEDMAYCIVTATKNLYHAVCEQFQPSLQRPCFMFSHHDLQKVFQGMYLWQSNIPNTGTKKKKVYAIPSFPPVLPEAAASVLDITHLWMHECMRTFADRLYSEDESRTLVSLVAKVATTHFGIRLADSIDAPPTVTSSAIHTQPTDTAGNCKEIDKSLDTVSLPQDPKPIGQSDLKKDCTLTEPSFLSENNRSEEANRKTHLLQHLILQHMENIMPRLFYGPEVSGFLNSMDQQNNFKSSSCYRELDLNELLQKLLALTDRKEDDKGHEADNNYNIASRCIVHRQRASQLAHILRALLIPGGHGVLIGSDRGTGRKTTVRLAAHLTGYHLMELHSGNEDKLHEILKEAGNRCRVDGGNVIILVHEEIRRPVREELLVAMAYRTYPALHTEEELRNLVSRVTDVKNSRKYLMDSWMFDKYLSQVHRKVHVFLLMSFTMSDTCETPANNGSYCRNAQMTKALSLSCCVEVYQLWSCQSLVEVAAQCLRTGPKKLRREGSEASLSATMAGIHQSACQYASVLLTAQPFSPRTYMEFIAHFGYLCNHLHKQWQCRANRVASVLSRMDVLNNTAMQYKRHSQRLKGEVAEKQQHEKVLLRAIDDQKSLLEDAKEKCVVEGNRLYRLEEEINHTQEQVIPVFLSGLKILKCLNPSDLEEVRHYRDPPDGVVRIMDAVCLLFNHPPGWESAKQLLGQSNFFQELEFFDRYSLTNEQLQQLDQIVHSPQFVPESVREVSKACESLCQWVQAVYECCSLQHQLLVKRRLELQAAEVRGHLRWIKQHKEDAYRRLEDVKLQLQMVQKDLEEQLLELHEAEGLETEAARAVEQLEAHVREWRAAAQEAELHKQNLQGDALVLAAVITYSGPFAPDVRTELLGKWRELCQTGRIDINPKDPRTSLFTCSDTAPPRPLLGFPLPVSERLQLPLGQALGTSEWQFKDTVSARLVVRLLLWSYRSAPVHRWPLMADTQQHPEITSQSWLIRGENAKLETEFGMVVCANDPELLDKLDQAAMKGLRVLVTHMEDANHSPQFLARLAPPAGCCLPGSRQHAQQTHPEFCLFLSTQLPVQLLSSEIHPSILALVHIIDLSLSTEETQELMLTQLLQSECKELLSRHLRLLNDKQLLHEKLLKEEEALMNHILQSNTSLLQDCDFQRRMAVCQEATKTLQAEIQQLSEELEYHEGLVALPRQLLRMAAALYQALQEVSRLSPAYYFSLRGFITVMQEALVVEGRPLVSDTVGKAPGDILPEITNRMVSQLLVQYGPRLFQRHVAVLRLLVSVVLLQHSQLCSEGERVAFLRGLQDVERPVLKFKPCSPSQTAKQSTSSLPSWIAPHIHPELLCLEKIPAFRGLISSLSTSPAQWQEYLHFPSSTVIGPVPCRSHSHLSLLQRALLWKTMLPRCLEGLADVIAACQLCLSSQAVGSEVPHTGNPESLSRYLVKHEGPIILALPSPRGDNWTSIQPLHLINRLADFVAETNEVQVKVISFGALCDRELILSALDKAANGGHWLVFNNCHLLEQWDEKVVASLSQLISFKEERCLIHPCFRLWFITQEYAASHIPVVVRMCALPLVCDSPWDLKEELSCSLRQVVSITQCLSSVTLDNMEALLRCAVFHSVLLQRQTSKYLGQGRIYNWTQEDLLALVDAHNRIANLCHDKTKVLQYIAVNLVHGGHVLDSADFEAVESVARTCLSRVSPLWEPHILSDIISNPGQLDLSGLLQILERGLQDSLNIGDSFMPGFSADVAAEKIRINSHNFNTLLQASQTPPGTVRSLNTQLNPPSIMPTYSNARDRLRALRSYLTNENENRLTNAGAISHSPLRVFLQAEWDDLIDSVSSLLSWLQQNPLTFSSLLKLTNLSRLEQRAELLGAYLWHRNISDPPGAYRLSAFRNVRGFLVAVMRQAAQANLKCISDIKLHFQVLSDSTNQATLPLDAVYLCGLELRGASWDAQLGALQDTVSPKPCPLPLVCVKAQVRGAITACDTFPCKSSYVMDTSNIQVSDASLSSASQLPVYHCPLYLDEGRETGDWGLADVNIVAKVPFHSKLDPVLCSLRRVRLVSTL